MSGFDIGNLSAVRGAPPANFGWTAWLPIRAWQTQFSVVARNDGYFWGLGAAVIWSGWWTVTRIGVADGLPAADLAAVRFGISGLLLLPVVWRERLAIGRVPMKLLATMSVGAGVPYALVAGTGVKLVSAGVGGALTVGLLPLFTLILSTLFLRDERVTPGLAVGIACVLAGAFAVAAGAWDGSGQWAGLGFFVCGALLWASYTVSLRRAGLAPLTAAAVVCVASLTIYTPIWLATGGFERLFAAPPVELTLQALYQALLSAVVALYFFGRAVERLGTTRASLFAAIVPALSMCIAIALLGERPSALELLGAVLLSAGAVAAARGRATRLGRRPDPSFRPH